MAFFRKRGDSWQYRISYVDPITNMSKEKSKGGFKTRKEAQLAAHEIEKQLGEGFEQTDITLKAYLHEWLHEFKKGTIRKNTFNLHEANIRNHILPHFKNVLLIKVKPIMYQKFLNGLSNQYSKRAVEIVHSTMYNAMNKAVTLGKLEKNPVKGPRLKENIKRESFNS